MLSLFQPSPQTLDTCIYLSFAQSLYLTIHIDGRYTHTHKHTTYISVKMYLCVSLSQGKLLKWYEMAKSHKLARVNAYTIESDVHHC